MFAFEGHYASATRAMAYVCTIDKLVAAFERPLPPSQPPGMYYGVIAFSFKVLRFKIK
jgi:hypothetical protein